MRRCLLWLFQNRRTGAITIAQTPNLVLWIVIVAALARWGFHPAGALGTALEIIVAGGLIVWAADEVLRGVNPWRRGMGIGVLVCEGARISGWL